jgi:uncharacterized iron-regulated membrane protein
MSEETGRRGSRTRAVGFSWRKLTRQVHLWIGLALCVPLVVLGLSGTMLVFADELRALLEPARDPAKAGEQRPVVEIIDAARTAAPAGFVAVFYRAPTEPSAPAIVRLVPSGRAGPPSESRQIRVDPVTLAVQLGAAEGDLLRQVLALHANLLMPGGTGRQIVGWLGIVMVALGISGLVNWWPRHWRGAFGVRTGATGIRLHRELHGAVGIWSLLVFMIVSVSGVYLAFPQTVQAVVASVLPARDLRAAAAAIRVEPRPDITPISVDDAIAVARARIGAATLGLVILPIRPDQPYRIGLLLPERDRGSPMITVFVDPWRRRVVDVLDPRHFTTGETILAWQHALHAGEGFGWIWKGLVAMAGSLPLLFAVTGVAMWWMKRRNRRDPARIQSIKSDRLYATPGAET